MVQGGHVRVDPVPLCVLVPTSKSRDRQCSAPLCLSWNALRDVTCLWLGSSCGAQSGDTEPVGVTEPLELCLRKARLFEVEMLETSGLSPNGSNGYFLFNDPAFAPSA